MTYSDWTISNKQATSTIVSKLRQQGLNDKQIIDYFQFDNMVTAEPNFCPLYETNTKCHDLNNLNCYLCGCPYFKYSSEPITTHADGTNVMSICTVGSMQAKTFTMDGNTHCDCSNCIIPHSGHVALQHLEKHNEN